MRLGLPILGLGASRPDLLNSATSQLGGVAPYHWLDFVADRALYAQIDVGNVTQATGYSFTRASQGYYQNADGTLTLFGYNLLLRSQEFDNASWSKVNATVTANATTAPDGTTTADLLVADTASGQHRLDQTTTIAAAAHTYSVFLKAGGYNFASIRVGIQAVGISLTDGTTNNLSAGCSVLVTAFANGWYRLALTCTALGNDTVRINVENTATVVGSFTGDGTSGIFIWGAQLEPSASVGTYVPTTSAAAGALRRGDRGVLIEGSRTNEQAWSQVINSSFTTQTNVTVTDNNLAAPDGTTTAALIALTSAATLRTPSSGRSTTTIAESFYVRAGNIVDATTTFTLYDATALTDRVAGVLTWATMTISGTGASIQRLGTTAWYRITLATSSWTSGNLRRMYLAGNGASNLGTSGHTFYVWGIQSEHASFPSSYIPTTSASVTRASDVLTYTAGVSYPVSMWSETERAVDTNTSESVLTMRVTGSDRSVLYITSDLAACAVVDGGAVQAAFTTSGTIPLATPTKFAARILTNDVRLTKGASTTQDTSVIYPENPTTLEVGASDGGEPNFGYIRRIAVFNSALTDAQLTASTT